MVGLGFRAFSKVEEFGEWARHDAAVGIQYQSATLSGDFIPGAIKLAGGRVIQDLKIKLWMPHCIDQFPVEGVIEKRLLNGKHRLLLYCGRGRSRTGSRHLIRVLLSPLSYTPGCERRRRESNSQNPRVLPFSKRAPRLIGASVPIKMRGAKVPA